MAVKQLKTTMQWESSSRGYVARDWMTQELNSLSDMPTPLLDVSDLDDMLGRA